MNELIEVLDLILEKSEKNKDGSLYVHKWLKNKIIKALNDYRKKEKKSNKVHKNEKTVENVEENKSVDLVKEYENNGWGRRKTRNKSYKKIRHEYL